MFRPLYNPEATDTAGGGESPVNFNDMVPVSWDAADEAPAESEEPAEEAPAQVAAEPVVQPEAVEPSATQPPVEPTGTAPAQVAAEPEAKPETPWNEAIKSVEKSEVLKAIGSKREILKAMGESDFIADLIDYYDANGNVDAYLNARAIDYDKLPDEEVIRRGIAKEYTDAPQKVLDSITQKELAKYMPEEDASQEEIDNANYFRKKAADKVRASFKEEQAKFTIPTKEAQAETPADPQKIISDYETSKQAEVSKNIAEYEKKATADERTQKLLANKSIAIAEGLNVKMDNVKDMIEYTVGKKNFISLFQDQDGNPDLDKWYKTLAYALDPDGVIKAAIDHGKTLAVKQEIDDDGNVIPDVGQIPNPTKELSDWNNLNKNGVISRF